MNLLKKILIHILIILIILMSCFSIYFANKHGLNIYAAVNDDAIYVPLRSQSDAVIAFQSYCKSRDLTIEGSLTDAVTTFTTGAFNSACNEIGIDITQLQAEIKAEYDASGKPVKFFFNDTGVMAMNRIFAQFLQDNELEVGDSVDNQELYNGKYLANNLLFITNSNIANYITGASNSFTSIGTSYISADGLVSMFNANHQNNQLTFTILGTSNLKLDVYHIDGTASSSYRDRNGYYFNSSPSYNSCFMPIPISGTNHRFANSHGFGALVYSTNNQKTYLCGIVKNGDNFYITKPSGNEIENASPSNAIVFITTNNTVINNNNYEGDTYITNEGDVINEGDNNNYNPYPDGGGPTTPSTGIGDGNGTQLTLPDLDLNLPSINWSIGDLTEKFPFSIPFDLIAFLTILNAEPETPEIQGNLNLAIVNWEFDYDLHQFDNLASLLRNLEFIGFCIGLVLITRSLLR